MKKVVWTLGHFPFIMGGRVWQEVGIEVEIGEIFNLGSGYSGFVVTAPNGTTFVAELESGAFVGPTIGEVMYDIKHADVDTMKQQVSEAVENSKRVRVLQEDDFWGLLHCKNNI